MAALFGNELVQVLPIDAKGHPAANTETVTTQQIANLGGGGGGGGTGATIDVTPTTLVPSVFIMNIALTVPGIAVVNVDPTSMQLWTPYTVKDADGVAGTYPIRIVPLSGFIDNVDEYNILNDSDAVDFFSDGTNLFTK